MVVYVTQGYRCALTLGWNLANAFGVIVGIPACWNLANAFGVIVGIPVCLRTAGVLLKMAVL